MRRLRAWILRFAGLFGRPRRDRELDEEIESHLQMHIEDNLRLGMTPEEARRQALIQLGGIESTKEAYRDQRGLPWLESLCQDLHYGARQLRRNPGFTAVAVLTLALGIGTNAAIFSLVDTVLLRMLPVERPNDLVFIHVAGSEGKGGAPPYPCFERFREESSAFSGMAAFAADELRVEVDGKVEQVFGQVASGNYFEVLGMKPAAGRLLTLEDEKLNPPVAVLGYSYWQRRFGGDPGVIGRSVSFRDRIYTIVGVTPAQFWGLQPGRQVDVTLPITLERDLVADAGAWWFDAVARLRTGVTLPQASAQADTIFQSFLRDQDPSSELRKKYWNHVELSSASRGLDQLRSRFSKPLYALTLVSAIVLLMACANLGALLLVRGAARSREFSIRLATGATAGRILRQMITESLLLFLIGAAASLPIAYGAVQGLTGFFAIGRNPILIEAPFDWRLGGFAAGIALAAGLLTGLWPAVQSLRTDPQAAMKEGEGRLAGSRRFGAVGRLLVAGQVALSLMLLVPAAMFAKTMANLRAV
ncbi:MAG: ABC transporter permease, partial [Verrucomicrobiae bacterium]|nr:ABC transporter permease [Verrucomicrobiae bacterium]